MPKVFIPLLTQLSFRSVSMETNMKTDNAFKQQIPNITVRYRPIHIPSPTLTISLSTVFLKSPTRGRYRQTDRQTDRKAGSVGPR